MESKNYLYENGYFLHIDYSSNILLGEYLDSKYSNETSLSVFDILNQIISVTEENKYLKILIVVNDDILSILEIRNNKIIKYYNKSIANNILFEVTYSNRVGTRINILHKKIIDSYNRKLIINSIDNELDRLFSYEKDVKVVKSLKKNDDKIKKM